MKFCAVCGKPLYEGMIDPWDFGSRYVHEECFEQYMNDTYGKGKWRPIDDDGEGGFYQYQYNDGDWEPTGIFYSTWPDTEYDIIERLQDAEAAIPTGWELEVDHFYNEDDDMLSGWYAMQYSESRREAIPIDGVNDFIIALDVELECEGIDIGKILEKYGCWVCE